VDHGNRNAYEEFFNLNEMLLSNESPRLEFMATLGLLPPYTIADVNAAYRARAMNAHPDRGGSIADFLKLHEAHERAIEHVNFIGDRRKWIANQVECLLRQQEVVAEVDRLGGNTEFEEMERMKHSVGDFAQLAVRLRVIRLQNSAADDGFLIFLAEKPPRAPFLLELSVAGTRITDKGLRRLTGFDLLRRLDLSGTRVTGRVVEATVESLPSVEWIGLTGVRVGWLSRWRLRSQLRERQANARQLDLLSPSG
jgi:hypothetical protein